MSESLLHARDIARMLNVRPSTVYALCRRGELDHIRLSEGRRRPLIRFSRQAVEAFLRERAVSPRARADK